MPEQHLRGAPHLSHGAVLVAHSGGDGLVAGAVDFDAGASACGDALDDPCALDGQDTAMIIFTSGTTSCPKGVEITHANMLFAGYYGDWQCALGPDDRMLTTMPAFHFELPAGGAHARAHGGRQPRRAGEVQRAQLLAPGARAWRHGHPNGGDDGPHAHDAAC